MREKQCHKQTLKMSSPGGGQVFKGLFRGAEIAAKRVFNTGRTDDKNGDFDREVAMLAQLVHPNVLLLCGVSVGFDGENFIVVN